MIFSAHIMEKFRFLVNVNYILQSYVTLFLKQLNHEYKFLDPNYDEV